MTTCGLLRFTARIGKCGVLDCDLVGFICDPNICGCVPSPCLTEEECDDGDLCTTDRCVDGICTIDVINCDDGNPCTVDRCGGATGDCTNVPVDCGPNSTCDPATGACGP